MKLRNILAASAVLTLGALSAHAQETLQSVGAVNHLYSADYFYGNLLQYTATIQTVGGNPQEVLTAFSTPPSGGTSTNPFIITAPNSGKIKEGISGTSDDLIGLVKLQSGGSELARFTLGGSFIGYVGNGATTFGSNIGSFVITPSAQDAYVADQGAGKVDEVSLATGKLVTSVSVPFVHDVGLLPNGNVIAENYSSSGAGGIEEFSSNLTGGVFLVPEGTPGETETIGSAGNLQGHHQYGYAVDNQGNIWTVSDDNSSSAPGNAPNTSGTLYEFSSTGLYEGSWTPTAGSGLAVGTYGLSFGGDGNLYLSDIGNAVLGSSPSGNQITEFNTYTDVFSTFIAGGAAVPNTTTGLFEPKYSTWQTDFAPNPDPGAPEPSGVETSIAFVGIVGLLIAGSKRKASRSV